MKSNKIRKLARSVYWQTLYSRAKDIGSIRLFLNDIEFSKLQLIFLQWLEVYHSLYIDISMGEKYINDEIIEDDIRTDAYLYYRRMKDKEIKDNKNKDKKQDLKLMSLPSVVFLRGKKKHE